MVRAKSLFLKYLHILCYRYEPPNIILSRSNWFLCNVRSVFNFLLIWRFFVSHIWRRTNNCWKQSILFLTKNGTKAFVYRKVRFSPYLHCVLSFLTTVKFLTNFFFSITLWAIPETVFQLIFDGCLYKAYCSVLFVRAWNKCDELL